jgi:hypothetical protein
MWLLWEEAHHLIPKFLGGWDELLTLKGLPPHLHDEFHRLLRANLAGAGVDLAENAGARAWQALMEDPAMFERVRGTLIQTADQFDGMRGTGVLSDLLAQMRRQGWL